MSLCLGYGLYLGARSGGGGGSWNPDELGGALVGWFDAEDASTLNLTGNLVNSITDKRNPTVVPAQSVTGSKPILSATGINGRASLEVDGTDDTLNWTTGVPYPGGNNPCEIWMLVRQDIAGTVGSERFPFGCNSASINASRRVSVTTSRRASAQIGTGSSRIIATESTVNFVGTHVLRSIMTGSTITAQIDGVQSAPVAAAAGNVGTTHAVIGTANGSTNNWQGGINSIYIIDPTHPNWTPENQAALLAYLKQRGGIA